jgi:hypothetical protein
VDGDMGIDQALREVLDRVSFTGVDVSLELDVVVVWKA